MRRRDLLKRIRVAAKAQGLALEELREGSHHTIFRVGGLQFPVPRHNEINEYTAQAIMKDLDAELGEEWWRR